MKHKKTLTKLEKETEKWYKKLEKTGFDDIETPKGQLKRPGVNNKEYHTEITWNAKVRYYSLAEYFLNDHAFETELEKTVWEYHSNGLSYRDISKVLKPLKLSRGVSRCSIANMIKRLRRKMYSSLTTSEDHDE